MNSQYKRKQVLVNRRVQFRVLGCVLVFWAAYHVVLWHVMLGFHFLQYCGARLAGGPPQPFSGFFGEFVDQHYSMLVCAVVVLPYLIWDVLKLTHRFVGPLVQFQRCLAALTRGEFVKDVHIRKGDFLGELRDSFNAYLSSPYAPRPWKEAPPAAAAERDETVTIEDEALALLTEVEQLQATVQGESQPVECASAGQ